MFPLALRLATGALLLLIALLVSFWLVAPPGLWTNYLTVMTVCVLFTPACFFLDQIEAFTLKFSTTLILWLTLFLNISFWKTGVLLNIVPPQPDWRQSRIAPFIVWTLSFILAVWLTKFVRKLTPTGKRG
jgi:hypothetical protein